jgi:hypothetical protein
VIPFSISVSIFRDNAARKFPMRKICVVPAIEVGKLSIIVKPIPVYKIVPLVFYPFNFF